MVRLHVQTFAGRGDILDRYSFCRIIIRVNLVPTLQTLKLILPIVVRAIILVGEPALRATLTRVLGLICFTSTPLDSALYVTYS